MKLLATLRGLIPPSSRSFHQLFVEFLAARQDVIMRLNRIEEEQRQQRRMLVDQQRQMKGHDAGMKLLMWKLYSQEQESYDDARKRFFRELPKADGELRLEQLASARLLADFDSFCKEAHLNYWMISGTLLGAYRHGGFIPWDDDIDLAMMREDLDKLIELAAGHERYQVTEVFDGYVMCRQIRFRYRDESIPCFVDVFFFDASPLSPKEAFRAMQDNRRRLTAELQYDASLFDWFENTPLVDASSDLGSKVGARFNSAIKRSYAEDGYVTRDLTKARSILWGVDNLDSLSGRPVVFAAADVYPLGLLEFEGLKLASPSNPPAVLGAIFGDYLDLPRDIGVGGAHIAEESLQDADAVAAMRALVGEERG